MNERRKFFESLLLAVAPGFQQLGKFVSQGSEIYHIREFSHRFSRMGADLIRVHPRSSVAKNLQTKRIFFEIPISYVY